MNQRSTLEFQTGLSGPEKFSSKTGKNKLKSYTFSIML